MVPFSDPAALRTTLERQLEFVAPVAVHLRSEVQGGGGTAGYEWRGDEWRGPAAESFRQREIELAALLFAAATAAESVVRAIRTALATLP